MPISQLPPPAGKGLTLHVDEWDAALADPAVDHATLAAQLDVDSDDEQRAARVREVVLAGRASGGATGSDLTPEDLTAAGLEARDMAAYMRVMGKLERS